MWTTFFKACWFSWLFWSSILQTLLVNVRVNILPTLSVIIGVKILQMHLEGWLFARFFEFPFLWNKIMTSLFHPVGIWLFFWEFVKMLIRFRRLSWEIQQLCCFALLVLLFFLVFDNIFNFYQSNWLKIYSLIEILSYIMMIVVKLFEE